MSHYLQNEYFQDEEPDSGEFVVERAQFRPKEDIADAVRKMMYRFFFLAILLSGIILTFTYRETIFNPWPDQVEIVKIGTDDAEVKADMKTLMEQKQKLEEQNEVLKLVNMRQIDPGFPLNNYNRELILKHWPHLIQGYTSTQIKDVLVALDMRLDAKGNPRTLTAEEIATLDKEHGKNRKIRQKTQSALMMSVGDVEFPADDTAEDDFVEVAANAGETEKPANVPEVKKAEKKPSAKTQAKKNGKPPKKTVDPLRAELTDMVMGQTQQMVDRVLHPVREERVYVEDTYDETEEVAEDEDNSAGKVTEETPDAAAEGPKTGAAAPKVEIKTPVVYDVDALDAVLGVGKHAKESSAEDEEEE